ncbi:MAG: serine--tRNA ligase [Candidatus Eisenbacteria bacterium]
MLDPKFIRTNLDRVRAAIEAKGEKVDIEEYIALDKERLAMLVEVDSLKAERNRVSEEIAGEIRSGKDPAEKKDAMRAVSKRIKEYDDKLKTVEEKLGRLILWFPNVPHQSVPIGHGEDDNKIIRAWGRKPEFDFKPVAHWDIAEALDIVDFKRGTTIAASNFVVFKGLGAKLARAIINFMLDFHTTRHGYKEISPPVLVNRDSMTGTGQLPKLEEDMYHCGVDDLFLIPTAEVPLTNLHRDEILDGAALPLYYTAYTPCFRREAGSYGKDTRGLNRVHQFDKVELVKFVEPEKSYDELEKLVGDAEEILQAFGLHYRVNLLCTGELSFSASKCYDLEVWSPGQEKWLEVSSCSNFEDFQARRIGVRYRPAPGEKARLVHTLNGSGVALPRTIIAILETYQTKDGRVRVPEVLVPYMGGVEVIE